MLALVHQNEPSGWSAGHFGPATQFGPQLFSTKQPSFFPGPSAKRTPITTMQ